MNISKDDLETGAKITPKGTAVELSEFQEDAVRKARKTLALYSGVMIADSVGLGKTWIGKRLLEDYAYHLRQKALVICPASLRDMWISELASATISATVVSQELLGREEFSDEDYGDADIILVDESHNFRNNASQRYGKLESLIGRNGGRGRDGSRKKVILMTATPISNDLLDLYNQINLVTQGDRSYFSSIGIGDLRRYFLEARRQATDTDSRIALFNLLEEFAIRRTRQFIKESYPNATIMGEKIKFPERKLKTIKYDLEDVYRGIYRDIVEKIENLNLAPYNLESYKKEGVTLDFFEQGRQSALVGIFKTRYLKRFESSIDAFKISISRALQFQKTFESYLLDGKLMDSSNFQKALQFLAKEDMEDDAMPDSLADKMDEIKEAKEFLDSLPTVDVKDYDLRDLHKALQEDIEALGEIWNNVKYIKPADDTKIRGLKELLMGSLKGKKVIIFTYYKDTARYIERELTKNEASNFIRSAGNPNIRRMDSGNHPSERTKTIQAFAPHSNKKPEIAGTDREIDILISTDILSEGQNLQDCGYLINYDLHWNPTRMIQRSGRIDRIGSPFDQLWIYNMFPDEGLEELLGIVERLSKKIIAIDSTGFLDASILGETVHPRNFGTINRIMNEDGTVIDEEEQFTDLASSEFLMQQLKDFVIQYGKDTVESLPDGIHSGLAKRNENGLFFYFQAREPESDGKLHFWKYYDLRTEKIIDNRFLIANLIACKPDTTRVISEVDVFKIHDMIIDDILKSQEEQQALEEAPKRVDVVQQRMITLLQSLLSNSQFKRKELLDLIKFVSMPKAGIQIREFRRLLAEYSKPNKYTQLVTELFNLMITYGSPQPDESSRPKAKLKREDLYLICFDHICGS